MASTPDSHVRIQVRQRPQQVVVRAGAAARVARPVARVRSDMPTLIGLDVRERQDTLPDSEADPGGWDSLHNDWLDEPKTLLALKRRPLVIREYEDPATIEAYRAEAARIVASGLFGKVDD